MGQDQETVSFLGRFYIILLQETWNLTSRSIVGYEEHHVLAEKMQTMGTQGGAVNISYSKTGLEIRRTGLRRKLDTSHETGMQASLTHNPVATTDFKYIYPSRKGEEKG